MSWLDSRVWFADLENKQIHDKSKHFSLNSLIWSTYTSKVADDLQAWPIMVAYSPQATKNVCGRPEVPQVLAHVASKKNCNPI